MAQINKPTDYFETVIYTGNGVDGRAITDLDFKPDWCWFKSRNAAGNWHDLYDSVRGATKRIFSNESDAEQTQSAGLQSFTSNGFTLGTNSDVNQDTVTYASWNWLASNTTASNTDGSITSTVSANTTSGFSIVSYSGSNSNSTVGHGLGVAPKVIIIKRRNVADNWRVLHMSVGNDNTGHLNLTDAFSSSAVFQNTSPTSTVFSLVGNNTSVNQSGSTYIAYCFAEKKGFSKFGSYTGNGNADGTFVYTGFRPAWIMIKRTDGADTWTMYDNKRIGYNVDNNPLFANADTTESTDDDLDILSNGFKIRRNSGRINTDGANMVYMAFAENPLVGTNNIPATAR